VLEDLFSEMSEGRVSYQGNKVVNGLALTNWLIQNQPKELHELASLLVDILKLVD